MAALRNTELSDAIAKPAFDEYSILRHLFLPNLDLALAATGLKLEEISSITWGAAGPIGHSGFRKTYAVIRGSFDRSRWIEFIEVMERKEDTEIQRTDGDVFVDSLGGSRWGLLGDGRLVFADLGSMENSMEKLLASLREKGPASSVTRELRASQGAVLTCSIAPPAEILKMVTGIEPSFEGLVRATLEFRVDREVRGTAVLRTDTEPHARALLAGLRAGDGMLLYFPLPYEWTRTGDRVEGRASVSIKSVVARLRPFVPDLPSGPPLEGQGRLDLYFERAHLDHDRKQAICRFDVSPDDDYVLIRQQSGVVEVRSEDSDERRPRRGLADGPACFTGDNRGVVVWRPGHLAISHRMGFKPTNIVKTPPDVAPGHLAPILGTSRVVAVSGDRLWTADLRTGKWRGPVRLRTSGADSIAVDAKSNAVAVLQRPRRVEVVDLEAMRSRHIVEIKDGKLTSRIVAGAGVAFVGTDQGVVHTIRLRSGGTLRGGGVGDPVRIAPRGSVLVALDSGGSHLAALAVDPGGTAAGGALAQKTSRVHLRVFSVSTGSTGEVDAKLTPIGSATYSSTTDAGSWVEDIAILGSRVLVGGVTPLVWRYR